MLLLTRAFRLVYLEHYYTILVEIFSLLDFSVISIPGTILDSKQVSSLNSMCNERLFADSQSSYMALHRQPCSLQTLPESISPYKVIRGRASLSASHQTVPDDIYRVNDTGKRLILRFTSTVLTSLSTRGHLTASMIHEKASLTAAHHILPNYVSPYQQAT